MTINTNNIPNSKTKHKTNLNKFQGKSSGIEIDIGTAMLT